MPRIFAVDVDGTLLTSGHEVSPATRDAVAHVRLRGAEVLLATSRGPKALFPVLLDVDLLAPAAFVASQGAVTARYGADGALELIARHPMPLDAARRAVEMALDVGIAVSWYSEGQWLVSGLDEATEAEARIVGVAPDVRDLLAETEAPDKIMLIAPGGTPVPGTQDGRQSPLRRLAELLPRGLRAQTSNPSYLEVTRSDVDKAEALRAYCAARGVSARDVVAIGDGPNDLGMLAFAGTAIAPANAHPTVLAAAHLLTSSNDEDGVARALRAMVP